LSVRVEGQARSSIRKSSVESNRTVAIFDPRGLNDAGHKRK
jgi:hypothetical protein